MPLYIADYMADTAHLSTVEHGAYLLLIMTYWQRGEALPDDDKKLARIAGLQGRNWRRVRAEIEPFFEVRDNKWVSQKVEKLLLRLRSQSKANSLNGKKGGQATATKSVGRPPKPRLSHTDTDTDNTLSKDNGASADPDKVFWANALDYLGQNKRGMVGRWCSKYGKAETGKAITEAQIGRAVDPVPYIERILKGKQNDDWEYTGP